MRLKSFQSGKRNWQKGIVRRPLDERSYVVETFHNVVPRNRVHLRLTNEPSPPLSDKIPAGISAAVPVVPASCLVPSYESQISSSGEVSPPTSIQRGSSLSN